MIEKERKFLLSGCWKAMEPLLRKVAEKREVLIQNYLKIQEGLFPGSDRPLGSHRVRETFDVALGTSKYTETYKSKKFNNGLSCLEAEYEISPETYRARLQDRDQALSAISKERLIIPIIQSGRTYKAEMDVYMDDVRKGLVVLEVEDGECECFDVPKGWIEVTEDLRFGNNQLAGMNRQQVLDLIKEKLDGK